MIAVRELRLRPVYEYRKPNDLLGWFLEGFRAEVPERLNTHRISPYGLGLSEEFRAYMEDDTTEDARLTDDNGTHAEQAYRFPMRTALRALAGKGSVEEPFPFMARVLYLTACMGGDWNAVCADLDIPRPVRRPYVHIALERLYERYCADPPARLLRGGRMSITRAFGREDVNSAGVADARQAS